MLLGFEQESAGLSEAELATPGTVLVPPSETIVERLATPIDTPTMSKLVLPLRTCQGQRWPTPWVESWRRAEVRGKLHVHG